MKIKKYFMVLMALAVTFTIATTAYALNNAHKEILPVPLIQEISAIQELNDYVSAVKGCNSQFVRTHGQTSDIVATITFSKYLTFDEFKNFAEKYSLQIQQIQVRGLDSEGTRITVFTLVENNLFLTEEAVNSEALANGFEIAGITDVYVHVNPDELASICNDSLAYLVDTSGNGTSLMSDINADTDRQNITYFPKSLTWELEEFGILKQGNFYET